MKSSNCFAYITFRSVHDAMKAEADLQADGFQFETVPVPRRIRTDCGIALKVDCNDRHKIEERMIQRKIRYTQIVEYS